MNWRGRYGAGPFEVTAKHWWSPKERKSAQMAARLLAHQADQIKPGDMIRFSGSHMRPTWKPN